MGKLGRRVANLVAEAKVAKDSGDHDTALEKLTEAAGRKGAQSEVAGYELALLYAQLGRHQESDVWLSKLGFTWKLSPSLLDHSCLDGQRCTGDKLVVAFDAALPPEVCRKLQEAFDSTGPFWREHGYPTPGFFSYNQPWEDANLISSAARCLADLARGAKLLKEEVHSVEWWAHSRPSGSGSGHQLHFDLDEVELKEAAEPKHPLMSCVLFLSGEARHPSATMAPWQLSSQ